MGKTKVCNKCGKEYEHNLINFKKDKTVKCGIGGICKSCLKILNKIYRDNHKKESEIYRKQYYGLNKERKIEYAKQRYQNKKEQILETTKKYYQANKKRYRENYKLYRETNIIKESSRIALWQKNNKEKGAFKAQRYRARKRELPSTLTSEQWENAKQYFNNCCAYCGKELPLAQDHFISLNKGGEYAVSNIIPSCKSCNSGKRDKDFFEWYPSHKYYSKKREQAILKFLNYKDNTQQLKLL